MSVTLAQGVITYVTGDFEGEIRDEKAEKKQIALTRSIEPGASSNRTIAKN